MLAARRSLGAWCLDPPLVGAVPCGCAALVVRCQAPPQAGPCQGHVACAMSMNTIDRRFRTSPGLQRVGCSCRNPRTVQYRLQYTYSTLRCSLYGIQIQILYAGYSTYCTIWVYIPTDLSRCDESPWPMSILHAPQDLASEQ